MSATSLQYRGFMPEHAYINISLDNLNIVRLGDGAALIGSFGMHDCGM
jgi:hypothetical protein